MTDTRGWQERWDELEMRADPALMPLIISLRADMELACQFGAHALRLQKLALEQRQQILDAEAIASEWAE